MERSVAQLSVATTNGPYSPRPYYLRVTKDGMPDDPTTYNLGDTSPCSG